MNTVYLIGIILIVKLFCSFYKRNHTSHELIKSSNATQKQNKSNRANQKLIKPQMTTKNKWLNPINEFGDMEKGVVYESQTYEREITLSTKHSDFEIL